MTYLTEKKLGEILDKLIPDNDFIHNEIVPKSGCGFRPDYRSESLKLIIEYDNDTHYCSSLRILKDRIKDDAFTSMGYTVFRIPYFVQMSTQLLRMIFKGTMYENQLEYKQEYPHGFISKKVVLPADYCEQGTYKFIADTERFKYLNDYYNIHSLNSCIRNSLATKYHELFKKYGVPGSDDVDSCNRWLKDFIVPLNLSRFTHDIT